MAEQVKRGRNTHASTKVFFHFSFFSGMVHAIDFGQRLRAYRHYLARENADYRAIASDWQALGFDMQAALKQLDNEHQRSVHASG